MKEHPIIFNTEHVKAILDGRKTQTRRVVTPQTSIVGVGKVDWSKFDWDGKTEFDFGDSRYSTESEFVPAKLKGQLIGVKKAPLPLIDGDAKKYHYQYLHVPWNWGEDATIFRIYPKWDVRDRLWVRETFMPYCGIASSKCEVRYKDGTARRMRFPKDYTPSILWKPSIFMPQWASRITLEITDIRVERLCDITVASCIAEGLKDTAMIKYDFKALWDSLNKKRGYGWEVNPWVWTLSFKVVSQ